eukprot:TRINITY_DN59494_c0_g1_i1.p1 TRINITY_DN59494_c0_g1~~TRINITY_DN59494_c0_g1_i1.p1  ORF type:complete len:260 (-),score=25.07 TRINITY_DN59494_c0_g1_i1:10-789(-)
MSISEQPAHRAMLVLPNGMLARASSGLRCYSTRERRQLVERSLALVGVCLLCTRGTLLFAVEQGIRYGPHPLQIGDLLRPSTPYCGVAMLLHGGFWQGTYDRSLMADIATDLVSRDLAVWNVEYRSVGTGGGYPATLDDVSLALDWLASDTAQNLGVSCRSTTNREGLPLAIIGHSAGGLDLGSSSVGTELVTVFFLFGRAALHAVLGLNNVAAALGILLKIAARHPVLAISGCCIYWKLFSFIRKADLQQTVDDTAAE